MSAPSGIKVPETLTSAFADAKSNAANTRALVFVIDGGESCFAGVLLSSSTVIVNRQ